MITSKPELFSVLRQYNPWWGGQAIPALPTWKRAAFRELRLWLREPPAPRAILLSGARQIGKTTLLLQAVQDLLDSGVPPTNIIYATLDHPLLKLAGLDELLGTWRQYETIEEGTEYIFIDEIQFAREWQSWLKLQVDFHKNRRFAVTGSATPLNEEGQESGVGRWHTMKLATLSFYEFLQLKLVAGVDLPELKSLAKLFEWPQLDFVRISAEAAPLMAHFHDYLVRGGFPQCAMVASVDVAQKLLREDIVDKVLKRDMTAFFGVRRVLELEQTFLYLCLHDGGLLDVQTLCSNLEVKKPTVNSFLNLLEATHLIHKLRPYGYGKEVLRGRFKVYLADAAIAPSVLIKGRSILQDPTSLGRAVETAFFKHVFTRYYGASMGFSYWRGKADEEVDMIAETGDTLIPFEIKYRHTDTGPRALKGLRRFCEEKNVSRGYVITRDLTDFGPIAPGENQPTRLMKVPAALACYWLGQSELNPTS